MAEVVKIITHNVDAKSRQTAQFRERPRFEGLVGSFADQVQDIEDVLISYLDSNKLALASGALLDKLGELVGAERQGFDDDFFRVIIYVKIAENYTEGQPGPLIQAYKLMTNATHVQYENLGNGTLTLTSDGFTPLLDTSFMISQLERLVAAGVKIISITFVNYDDGFAFEGGPGLGFADPLGQGGGKLAVYIPV